MSAITVLLTAHHTSRAVATTDAADPTGLIGLTERATLDEPAAWEEIVDRFMPLVRSIVRAHRLGDQDGEDVHQLVWLKLFERLPTVTKPEALPGWVATVTRNECINVIRARNRYVPTSHEAFLERWCEDADVDDGIMRSEIWTALLEGLALLPRAQRELLELLACDPPLSYQEISRRAGLPVGGIGPTRARALRRLREMPFVAALIEAGYLI